MDLKRLQKMKSYHFNQQGCINGNGYVTVQTRIITGEIGIGYKVTRLHPKIMLYREKNEITDFQNFIFFLIRNPEKNCNLVTAA